MTKFLVGLLFSQAVYLANASEKILRPDAQDCVPPKESSWNMSIDQLVKRTEIIFIGELVRRDDAKENSDILPDFQAQGGIAIDSVKDKSGFRKTTENGLIPISKWTFNVVSPLKGNIKKGDSISFNSVRKLHYKRQLTPVLCDFPLDFKKGEKYIIFYKSYHPHGYDIYRPSDSFIKGVKNSLKSDEK